MDTLLQSQTKFVSLEKSSSDTDKGEKKSKSLKQQVWPMWCLAVKT